MTAETLVGIEGAGTMTEEKTTEMTIEDWLKLTTEVDAKKLSEMLDRVMILGGLVSDLKRDLSPVSMPMEVAVKVSHALDRLDHMQSFFYRAVVTTYRQLPDRPEVKWPPEVGQ
jgi:hypothetical protein